MSYEVPRPSFSLLPPALSTILKNVPWTGAVPNPIPVAQRAAHLAADACAVSGMAGDHGVCVQRMHLLTAQPDWYEKRMRLASAYAMAGRFAIRARVSRPAELSLATQPTTTTGEAQKLLSSLAHRRSIQTSLSTGLQSARQIAAWGGRGWLGMSLCAGPPADKGGILRSVGL